MLRRDFLGRLAAVAASAGRGRGGISFVFTPDRQAALTATAKLARIAISTWSLHNYFRATRSSNFNLPGPMLVLLDFPDMLVDKYQVRHFEFCASHFGSTDPAYLHEIRYALLRTRSTIVNILVDIKECGREGTFSDPDRRERRAALDAAKLWVDMAHALGVTSVCVGPGREDPKDLARTVESYQALALYAQAKGVRVMVENQGSFGTDHPEELVKLFRLAGPGRLGALPDFGNFPDEPTRERGLKMLFPYAPTLCHAKGLEFDADGTEKGYDFPKALAIAQKAGFRGVYSIEFDGPGDPYAGIQRTLDELLRYL